MAVVTYITGMDGWGSSFSGTLNLPKEFSSAMAQVALTSAFDSFGCHVYLTGYSANGNPVSLTDGPVVLPVDNVDSFSFAGNSTTNGSMTASIMAYCFE